MCSRIYSAAILLLITSSLCEESGNESSNSYKHFRLERGSRRSNDSRMRRKRPDCPLECICLMTNVYCDGVFLRSVPRYLNPNSRAIYMRNNHIRRLSYRRFRNLGEVRHLLLKGNRILEIEHHAFQDMRKLISLSLTDNNLPYLPADVFYALTDLKVVSMRHNKIRRIEGLFAHSFSLQLINLGHNRIKHINERAFQRTTKLRVLDLNNNHITYIAPNAFVHLPELKYLVLRGNPFTHLQLHFNPIVQLKLLDASDCELQEVIRGLPKFIDDFRLDNNQITELQADSFKGAKKIRLLVLNNNKLNFVHQKALTGLKELYDLYIGKNFLPEVPQVPGNIHAIYANYNNITHLFEGTFKFSTRLEFIFLRYNSIEEIEETAFHGLRFLRSFDLSRNKIMQLKRYTFLYMNRLELLDLTKNPLEELEYGCFHGLRSLSILQMSSVSTKTSIIPSTFRDMHKLAFLDLSNSSTLVHSLAESKFDMPPFSTVQDLNLMDDHLHMLPPDFPKYFPRLRVIKLVGNPWHCNRTILWLVDWINNSTVEFYASNYMTCATPPELKGRALQTLDPEELFYDIPTGNQINLDDYDLILEISDNKNENGHLTPGELNLEIFPKRGSQTAGFSDRDRDEFNKKPVKLKYEKKATYIDPYGQVTEDNMQALEGKDFKYQNSVIKNSDKSPNSVLSHGDNSPKDSKSDSVAAGNDEEDALDPEKVRELLEGTTFQEVQRPAGSTFHFYDDSSGFVEYDEFLIV